MKRLFVFAISLFLLQIAKATPFSVPDSSRTVSQADVFRDTVMVPITNPAPISFYQNNLLKRRLDSIQKEVPLDYNEYVQSYIDLYLTPARREDISRALGLTKYYFPIYEKAFREAGIPEEIEYLSIVESQLNPNAISHVGATGPWQFMATTAKTYGLGMDGYVDERRDPIQSSYAAAAYLKDAYQQFGDWLLAIASYNCGKSNVIRAIELAGANDFWSIRQYLPVETRGYVPAYIAVTYLMNYHKKYHITPRACNFSVNTDTVSVSKTVSLYSVSRSLNVDLSQLAILNPAYVQQIVNGTESSPRRLVIPQSAKEKYAVVYQGLNSDLTTASVISTASSTENRQNVTEPIGEIKISNKAELLPSSKKEYISYKVQPGDTLPVIVHKFEGTSVEEIKQVNGLKSEDVQPGMMLMISKS